MAARIPTADTKGPIYGSADASPASIRIFDARSWMRVYSAPTTETSTAAEDCIPIESTVLYRSLSLGL